MHEIFQMNWTLTTILANNEKGFDETLLMISQKLKIEDGQLSQQRVCYSWKLWSGLVAAEMIGE